MRATASGPGVPEPHGVGGEPPVVAFQSGHQLAGKVAATPVVPQLARSQPESAYGAENASFWVHNNLRPDGVSRAPVTGREREANEELRTRPRSDERSAF
jgi:hypothetical protein